MVYESKTFSDCVNTARNTSNTNSSVLICGETGTGKELIAREIANKAGRKFVPLNVGGISPALLESELFGFKKGSFTGASMDKIGAIEYAQDGILYLDEISSLQPNVQPIFHRLLSERQFKAIGCNSLQTCNAKFISASNRNLLEMVDSGSFMRDLYYRISECVIYIPPLRERTEDIIPIFEDVAKKWCQQNKIDYPGITEEFERFLKSLDLQGNARELRGIFINVMERRDKNDRKPISSIGDYYIYLHKFVNTGSMDLNLKNNEIQLIKQALNVSNKSKKKAADLLGIPISTLYDRIKKYELG